MLILFYTLYYKNYLAKNTSNQAETLPTRQCAYGVLRANAYTIPEEDSDHEPEQISKFNIFATNITKMQFFKFLSSRFTKNNNSISENYLDDSRALPTEEERQVIMQFSQNYHSLDIPPFYNHLLSTSNSSTIVNHQSRPWNNSVYYHAKSEPTKGHFIDYSLKNKPIYNTIPHIKYTKRLNRHQNFFVKDKTFKNSYDIKRFNSSPLHICTNRTCSSPTCQNFSETCKGLPRLADSFKSLTGQRKLTVFK
ncbi:hypothetical protein BB561_002104 [Smittium simulii]|uniref:Uncharacterized protein n=1 Tax=Smittium simulii TaxID=133385 RepID=A0A2T9YRN4_9FUNG|nr:hypothetical protein BB561_002104 [Smittium simulii]